MSNLLIAFPEKTEKERRRIAKKFYHNFVDSLIETIKMITASDAMIQKHVSANWEEVNKLKGSVKKIQLHIGHNFNWDWGSSVAAKHLKFPMIVVYMPIGNKHFERLFLKLRTKTGNKFIRATHMSEDFAPYRDQEYFLGLVADQNPGDPTHAWWFNFFGKPTPFVKGPARGAIANDTAVVFAFIHKPKRGQYVAVLSTATTRARDFTESELTGKFVDYMEDVIRQYPEMWLWSHRRWKHQWKPEYGPVQE